MVVPLSSEPLEQLQTRSDALTIVRLCSRWYRCSDLAAGRLVVLIYGSSSNLSLLQVRNFRCIASGSSRFIAGNRGRYGLLTACQSDVGIGLGKGERLR